MNKAILALTLTLSLSGAAWASDTQPDPSDLTAVNSFAYGTVDNEGKLNAMLGLAGNYSEGNNFIGLVEHNVATKNNQLGKKRPELTPALFSSVRYRQQHFATSGIFC
ncbi:hypothetical protein L1D44_20990 [Shewanella sp. Isolate13]|uniref:hypothetical protein n=1 Tax=Shewanella sp. Isolate13 TaxID=2908531 RepID=UPI001EFE4A63|nr:hypothetical protein [Shewanella sp. Isolate13]MCG9732260.1 hypothetical protein [Shewanella sp. Isolate13]